MFNQFNPVADIDRRIEDLQRLKNNYSNSQMQQPINIYNNNNSVNDFKAQYINENDNVEDLIVTCKTCFISLKKGYIAIKDTSGNIEKYEIVIPETEEQKRIRELERRLSEYESTSNDKSIKQSKKSASNDE